MKAISQIEMPKCSCCGHLISPEDIGSVRFPCPNCGDITIFRCMRCRSFGRNYRCPKCSFEGP
ncbi:MAG: zinc finger domain-containing protein [Promethearchaeota archaeon]